MNVQEEIRKLAYDFYEKNGGLGGRDLEYWLKAEQIIMAKLAAQGKAEPAKKESEKKRKTTSGTAGSIKPKRTAKKPETKSGEKKGKTKG